MFEEPKKITIQGGYLLFIPKEMREYYESFMCRLILNSESHMEERVYNLDTTEQYFTKQEKVVTAKSILLFLSYVNEEHLACYLSSSNSNGEDKVARIKSWETALLSDNT